MSKETLTPLPIMKYDDCGTLVATYKRLVDVISDCRIGYYKLEIILVTGELYKGFVYKPSGQMPSEIVERVNRILAGGRARAEISVEKDWTKTQLWEGRDGFFDIKGWAKSIY